MTDEFTADAVTTIEQLVFQVGWLEQRRFAQDVAGFGLTPAQFFVLRAILGHDSLPTMGTLAYDTLQHCATISGIVDRLEKMGLVVRVRDQQDRRQMLVKLTPAGRDVLARVRQTLDGA
ncbi:MAG TPA: MarR family transcriptional regulator [Anaerolineae bacterium]|nr:MarR family transcriptional regulator [Anaerolineae bacterium]